MAAEPSQSSEAPPSAKREREGEQVLAFVELQLTGIERRYGEGQAHSRSDPLGNPRMPKSETLWPDWNYANLLIGEGIRHETPPEMDRLMTPATAQGLSFAPEPQRQRSFYGELSRPPHRR